MPDAIVTSQKGNPAEPVTTAGVIAMHNLQAQIKTLQSRDSPAVAERANLINLIALRGQICGRIVDGEEAAALAEELVNDSPRTGQAHFVRSQTRSMFHLFSGALRDLDLAERNGVDASTVNSERAGIFEAVGRYDEALALCREAASRMPDFQSVAALAAIHAARGECDVAERMFQDSRGLYRGVSPFPLAMLDFQRGHMWLAQDSLERARGCFMEAQARLPAYAAAQGHLAEVDAALGNVEAAIARLRPLATSSDDPDYAAQLSRILEDAGRAADARPWRAWAAARYDELVATHLEAFADHAAEFWLMGNADPKRALRFAKVNFEARKTKRARDLLARALNASGPV